jgi:hypothetical protein
MSSLDASSYDQDLLLHSQGNIINKGTWSAKDWCFNKEVLILGAGESIQIYQKDIIQYIKTYKPIVVSINVVNGILEEFVDVYVSSNQSRIIADYNFYTQLDKPLAIPKLLLERVVNKPVVIKELWDYGLSIKYGAFAIYETECTLPYELSIGYALSLVQIGGANSINLVGFDGYDRDDVRQTRMHELLGLFNKQTLTPITALTPTTYHIAQGSIYSEKI